MSMKLAIVVLLATLLPHSIAQTVKEAAPAATPPTVGAPSAASPTCAEYTTVFPSLTYTACLNGVVSTVDDAGNRIILGRYTETVDGVMQYTGGATCNGNTQYSTSVTLTCGAETTMGLPGTDGCHYTISMTSPSACGDKPAAVPSPAAPSSPVLAPSPVLPSPLLPSPVLPSPKVLVLPSPVLPSPALPSPVLPSPALPSPALTSPALPSPALPSPALPSPALPSPALPSPLLPSPVLPSPALLLPSPEISPEISPEVSPEIPEISPELSPEVSPVLPVTKKHTKKPVVATASPALPSPSPAGVVLVDPSAALPGGTSTSRGAGGDLGQEVLPKAPKEDDKKRKLTKQNAVMAGIIIGPALVFGTVLCWGALFTWRWYKDRETPDASLTDPFSTIDNPIAASKADPSSSMTPPPAPRLPSSSHWV